MDIQKLAAEGRTEEIKRQLLDLDSQFSFKCRKCGKCCTHQDTILFNTRDIFNIARKLQLTPAEVIEKFAETYIGSASKIPVVHMVPRGKNEVCPFLNEGRCSIHDCKPTVCALFPLGRVVINKTALEGRFDDSDLEFEVRYMLNDIDCGSRKQIHTVREWLARFGIPEQDEFFLLWSKVTIKIRGMIVKLEEHHASNETLELLWNIIFSTLYLDYDTSKEFLPQFQKASEKLSSLCQGVIETVEQHPNGKAGGGGNVFDAKLK